MSYFLNQLNAVNPDPAGRRWLYVPYDQLSDAIGPLSKETPESLGIILVENSWKGARRPYHKQKLALILTNMRFFALEQADRGVAVRYLFTDDLYRNALEPVVKEIGTIRLMTPAEYELRTDLEALVKSGGLEFMAHEGWLTTREQFETSQKSGPPWRMDRFYRHIRRNSGILMHKDQPVGGKYSFDPENRKSWHGKPPTPQPPDFPVNEIKEEVGQLIQERFHRHPGSLKLHKLSGTKNDARDLWQWAKENCLPEFGPYEDAMSVQSSTLFHSRISSLLNIHRLLPKQIIHDVIKLDIPLPSKEGFIRQVLGWREFMHHVHDLTTGFREIGTKKFVVMSTPGDGGYQRWAGQSWKERKLKTVDDGGASPCELGCSTDLPPLYWGKKSGLHCLDHVVATVWEEGYSHHITRLMILSSLATLLDVSPRELTDWFWVAYTDAYDWVVEPNVLGMGTFALGDLLSTKPYVSGAAYINKMSDYCNGCAFDPKTNCPITHLYWAFLKRHQNVLENNPRMKMSMASLAKRSRKQIEEDSSIFESVRTRLEHGQELTPENLT